MFNHANAERELLLNQAREICGYYEGFKAEVVPLLIQYVEKVKQHKAVMTGKILACEWLYRDLVKVLTDKSDLANNILATKVSSLKKFVRELEYKYVNIIMDELTDENDDIFRK